MKNSNCPCGRYHNYGDCCGAIHNDMKNALTAEDLMRSRYSAFTMANGDYLQKSHHTQTQPTAKEAKEIETWAKSVNWIKLDVLNTTKGSENDSSGTVEFKAYFYEEGKVSIIHENSFFEKENGFWKYKNAF